MDEKRTYIDELYRSKEEPLASLPDDAWEKFEAKFEASQPVKGFWQSRWWYVLTLLFIGGTVLFFVSRSYDTDKKIPDVQVANISANNTHRIQQTSTSPNQQFSPSSHKKEDSTVTKTSRANNAQTGIQRYRPYGDNYEDSSGAKKQGSLSKSWTTKYSKHTVLPRTDSEGLRPERIKDTSTFATIESRPLIYIKIHPAHSAKREKLDTTISANPVIIEKNIVKSTHSKQTVVFTKKSKVNSLAAAHSSLAKRIMINKEKPHLASVQTLYSIAIKTVSATPVKRRNIDLINSSYPASAKKTGVEISRSTLTAAPVSKNDTGKHSNAVDSGSVKQRRKIHFVAGIGIGYETGFSDQSLHKMVVSPELKYYLTKAISINLQPAVKYGGADLKIHDESSSYYSPTGTYIDTQTVIKNNVPYYQITYSHTYDSIWVRYRPHTTSFEIDVPILAQYHFKNGLTIGGGANVSFGNTTSVSGEKNSINLTETAVFLVQKAGGSPAPDTSHAFNHTVPYYYNSSLQTSEPVDKMRFGYLVNIGWEYRRFAIDLSLLQNLTGTAGIRSRAIHDAYTEPFLRLMVSYRLWKK